jgi:N-acetylglucosaminyl-diphospho-decaprenol L-rhamnosyltransferase
MSDEAKPAPGVSPQTKSKPVDAVFLTWNSREQALECVRHTRDPDLVESIVVVDNASTDGTADAVRAENPDVTVIALEQGVGLAEALNMGAKLGSAPYVLYLNDDVFAEPGAIGTLLETLESHPEAVAAGGRLAEPDLSTQDQYRPRPFPSPLTVVARLFGFERLWPRNPWTGTHLRDKLDDHTTVEVDQPAGACLLVRRPVVDATGGWDERYWFWYEDVDFSRRLAQHGVSLYVPTAPFRHVGGATARRLKAPAGHARYFYGVLQYSRTHYTPAGKALIAAAMLAISLGRAALQAPKDRAGAKIYLGAARGALALVRGREIKRF